VIVYNFAKINKTNKNLSSLNSEQKKTGADRG